MLGREEVGEPPPELVDEVALPADLHRPANHAGLVEIETYRRRA